ncbi:hypothetical protein [Kribbella shirazensis]|uniref:Uncharacterized protein n=1 Tax=Kribbella shirazensis TaxID=1105143 RepID=A0A7X5VEE2_9ACTN|nr:hypothetical protein [Kribbella shirazensis]NIK58808.1 hypothetical protein [Kribbella shirazensis]
MEPLNLMVSLSHFADDKRDHKHGLSRPAGRARRSTPANGRPEPRLTVLRIVARIWGSRARVLS